MRLLRVRLAGIRNHTNTDLPTTAGTVILAGPNGSGKTSILEAISLLCTSRSFVTRQDRTIVTHGASEFSVTGQFSDSISIAHDVRVKWNPLTGKTIDIDGSTCGSASELIGRFPLVTLSPVHRAIIAGGPAERRAFMDFLISQLHRGYLADLMDYRSALRGRNALLEQCRLGAASGTVLDSWNAMLAPIAVRILRMRKQFLEDFQQYLQEAYAAIVEAGEDPELQLELSADTDDGDGGEGEKYLRILESRLQGDIQRGSTRVGPHRDDLAITLNGRDARTRTSQGQQKSLLIALKLAEYRYLADRLDEPPLLLFDDIFSEIDEPRLRGALAAAVRLGQTFITTVHNDLHDLFDSGIKDVRVWKVHEGQIMEEDGLASS